MKLKFYIQMVLLCALIQPLSAQDYSHKVKTKKEDSAPVQAKIDDFRWIAGHWTGEAFGGTVEEVWSEPGGGAMMCMFRLIFDNTTQFYELCTLVEENGSVLLRLKHFNGDLKGWEEKDESVEFPLVEVGTNIAYFDGFTFEKKDEDHMTVYVELSEGGKVTVEEFAYRRR